MDYQVIRIQHPEPHLLDGLDRLHRAFFEGSPVDPQQFMRFVMERLEDEAMLLILALAGDAPVGYGLAFDVTEHPFMPEWQRAGYITQLYVTPAHRRRCVGRLLVDHIQDWLASRGVRDILLNVVVDEPVSERFWRDQGLTPTRVRMRKTV